ncbi:DUF2264 domain-containing protein [Streptomyces diacarni]|uniref:DUF2264 domain-containing protein n=1 Tax=Streptomyces diacarni TaxID=2800381 RepID=A0A367F9C7_9ACTN|nr:DUF2264 domain-containing protein [Streptomyces diacarni]RCG26452.1 DUF2264 domain-containing protein [Streptomyces diacarni]
MPAHDRALSPYTGYTRAHWEAVADALLRAARQWATPRGALLHLPGRASVSGTRSDGLEGYARTFLAAAFRVAGAGGRDPANLLERYADGLRAGTRTPGRADAESWPEVLDHTVAGQPMVEAASVALALRLTKPWLWDRLEEPVRESTEAWLRGALRRSPAPNNWYLFPLSVAGFLDAAGRGDAETRTATERGLELLEGWWRGEGWYADGDGRAFDHYNGWALHLYPLLHAHLAGEKDLAARYGARLRAHLASFALLFGGDGAPVHFGRSLTYRFAAGTAVGLGALTGHTPLAPGVSRRLLSGTLRYFLDRGALDADGLLSLGWHGAHAPTVQRYSGPASPYWASKCFVALLVPPEDPLWTAVEEAAPSEGPDRALAVAAPGFLIQSTGGDGLVRLHNHGSDNVHPDEGEAHEREDPLYARFAYSTRTGPTARDNPPDNHLALALPSRPGRWSARRRIHPLGAGSAADGGWGWAASWHRPAFPADVPRVPGLRVESVTVVRGSWEVRAHRVLGAPAGTRLRLTGWAAGDEVASALRPAYGLETVEPLPAPHGTAYARWVRVPALEGEVTGARVCVALVSLGVGTAETPAPEVSVAGTTVTIRWGTEADRAVPARIRIGFDPPAAEAAQTAAEAT